MKTREQLQKELDELKQDMSNRVGINKTLLRISKAVQEMVRPSDLEKIMQVCLNALQDIGLNMQSMAIHRITDPDHNELETYRFSEQGFISGPEKNQSSLLTKSWQTGQAYRESNDGNEEQNGIERLWTRFGGIQIQSFIDVPFSRGVISIHSTQKNAFDESAINILEQVAEIFSLGLSRSEDIARLENQNQTLQTTQDELEKRVGQRTSALQSSNAQLRNEIQERKRVEQELQKTNQRLEGALSELKATQKQILRQERLAAVGQLTAGIAHDFNNLLTVMNGFAQLLKVSEDTPDSIKDMLGTISSQGERAAQLIRQILDFSRTAVAETQTANLVPVLKEVVKLFDRTLSETIEIKTKFGKEDYLVDINLTQFYQVMTNLSVNAKDAMPEGGILTIGLSRLTIDGTDPNTPNLSNGDWIALTVSDTGTGMAPEVLAHLFEPFFTTKKPDMGTGLGLSQVYGIIKQHGGDVTVESTLGKGSTFTIYLPEAKRNQTPIVRQDNTIPTGQGETILLVEDDAEVRLAIKTMLEKINYQVLVAIHGREALDLYQKHPDEIALVLTDIIMPHMGGIELYDAIRPTDKNLPFVLMTGYGLKKSENLKIPEGIVACLEKPHNLIQLAQTLGQALGK